MSSPLPPCFRLDVTDMQIGLVGVAGYPLNGLRKEINASLSKPVDAYLEASRFEQGREEMHLSSTEERVEVLENWILIEVLHETDCKRRQRSVVKMPGLSNKSRGRQSRA
jgi:hypothetical protein